FMQLGNCLAVRFAIQQSLNPLLYFRIVSLLMSLFEKFKRIRIVGLACAFPGHGDSSPIAEFGPSFEHPDRLDCAGEYAASGRKCFAGLPYFPGSNSG